MVQKLPKLEVDTVWLSRLTSRELMIVRQGLRRELKPEFFAEAERLEGELARLTVTETKRNLDNVGKLEQNLKP